MKFSSLVQIFEFFCNIRANVYIMDLYEHLRSIYENSKIQFTVVFWVLVEVEGKDYWPLVWHLYGNCPFLCLNPLKNMRMYSLTFDLLSSFSTNFCKP